MSGFSTCLVSSMCVLVLLTGQSTGFIWRTEPPPVPTYPADPNDRYYQAFQTVPPPSVTANKFMTNFLGMGNMMSPGRGKRSSRHEDVVAVIDGSGSIGSCEFNKGKEALRNLMGKMIKFGYETKYAAVTFSTSARVNFKFLPSSSAANEIMKITYPGGGTNTQAALAEAKKLFDNPSSGRRDNSERVVLLITDGMSNSQSLTILSANALKNSGVKIFVVGVGSYISGIDEMVKVASDPHKTLFRVKDVSGFYEVTKLILKQLHPLVIVKDYSPPC